MTFEQWLKEYRGELEKMFDLAYEEGTNSGYDSGYEQGNEEGYNKGYDVGCQEAMQESYEQGYNDATFQNKIDYDTGILEGMALSKQSPEDFL